VLHSVKQRETLPDMATNTQLRWWRASAPQVAALCAVAAHSLYGGRRLTANMLGRATGFAEIRKPLAWLDSHGFITRTRTGPVVTAEGLRALQLLGVTL
jgi:hypothetical protein